MSARYQGFRARAQELLDSSEPRRAVLLVVDRASNTGHLPCETVFWSMSAHDLLQAAGGLLAMAQRTAIPRGDFSLAAICDTALETAAQEPLIENVMLNGKPA